MTTEAAALRSGTPQFRHTILALFAAGFSTFALLYCVQPLMPVFSTTFGVSAAASSLTLSLTTLLLSVAMLVASSLSEAWGRKRLMVASLLASALLTIACAFAPGWRSLLAARALMGLTLSGLPAVAMAYVAEEMDTRSVGLAMGLYIAGTGLGGMAGRIISGVVADLASWRGAMLAVGLLGLVSGLFFAASLPPSRNFHPRRLQGRDLAASALRHLQDRYLLVLFAEGFLLMGGFVTIYNYIGYRLVAPPFSLSQAAVGLIFTVYLIGVFSSAWIGALAGHLGRGRLLWALLATELAGALVTLSSGLPAIILGMALLTFGFFGAHSIASAAVGNRARHAKAQASSLYLFFYYLGSSLVGSTGGAFWATHGWTGVVLLVAALLLAAVLLALRLVPPTRPR